MARIRPQPRPSRAQTLTPVAQHCPECHQTLRTDYDNYRTVTSPKTSVSPSDSCMTIVCNRQTYKGLHRCKSFRRRSLKQVSASDAVDGEQAVSCCDTLVLGLAPCIATPFRGGREVLPSAADAWVRGREGGNGPFLVSLVSVALATGRALLHPGCTQPRFYPADAISRTVLHAGCMERTACRGVKEALSQLSS